MGLKGTCGPLPNSMLRPLNKFDPPELVRGRDAPSDKDTLLKLLLPLNILRLLAGAVAGRDINRGHDEVLRRIGGRRVDGALLCSCEVLKIRQILRF